MNKKVYILRQLILFLFLIYSFMIFIGSTLSPIMAYLGKYNLSATFTILFFHYCHQQPDRSFWIFNYPIALCCRCYGFYLSTAVCTLFALIKNLKINLRIFSILFFLCCIDIIMNYFLNINTGNITRFFIGMIMGLLFTIFLCYIFEIIKIILNKLKEE